MPYSGDPRGALWRKWDLHVHTPASYEHEYGDRQAPETWQRYLDALASLPPEIQVLGINDYYSVEGYRRVREEWDAGRLPNIKCVLPVIELRLDHLAGHSETQRLNYHVVFSDAVSADDIERSFLHQLHTTFGEFNGCIGNPNGMAQLGAAVKAATPPSNRPAGSDVRVGFQHSFVPLSTVDEALSRSVFKGRHLCALGYTEWASVRWAGGGGAVRRDLAERVAFFLGCSAVPADHERHKAKLIQDGIPHRLLDASDAHRLSSAPQNDRRLGSTMTWMRADPTFEGLRRAIQRYDDRVFVGDEPPQLTRIRTQRHRFIRSVEVRKRPNSTLREVWFDSRVDLNPGLVAVIGNQGSGKSALTDSIALVANSEAPHFSFLNDQRFRKSTSNKASHFISTLSWEDGSSDQRGLDEDRFLDRPERARYVPQQFFDHATNEVEVQGSGSLYTEIEKAVFSHVPVAQRQERTTFRGLVDLRTSSIDDDLTQVRVQLGECNARIALREESTADTARAEIRARIAQRERLIQQVSDSPPTPVAPPTNETDGIAEALRRDIAALTLDVRTAQRAESEQFTRQHAFEALRDALTRAKAEAERIRDAAFVELGEFGEGLDASQLLSVSLNTEVLQARIDSCETAISRLKSVQDAEAAGSVANLLTLKENALALHTQTLSAASRAYETYQSELQSWQARLVDLVSGLEDPDALQALQAAQTRLETEIPTELAELRELRHALSLRVFALLRDKLQVYRDLAQHVQEFLQSDELTRERYQLEFDLALAPVGLVESYFLLVKHQGPLAGSENSRAWAKSQVDTTTFESAEAAFDLASTLCEKVVEGHASDGQRWTAYRTLLRSGRSVEELYDLLFGFSFLVPRYRLALGNRLLEELSPGERGILLLIFYLIVDRSDLPLIIDQPEGNLNNQSIYEHLVPVIRKAKESRQIVMVSHNPNIVVGCDADQVIHARMDKAAGCCLTYESGALENPAFREFAIEKLEGTRPAFGERTEAYVQ